MARPQGTTKRASELREWQRDVVPPHARNTTTVAAPWPPKTDCEVAARGPPHQVSCAARSTGIDASTNMLGYCLERGAGADGMARGMDDHGQRPWSVGTRHGERASGYRGYHCRDVDPLESRYRSLMYLEYVHLPTCAYGDTPRYISADAWQSIDCTPTDCTCRTATRTAHVHVHRQDQLQSENSPSMAAVRPWLRTSRQSSSAADRGPKCLKDA